MTENQTVFLLLIIPFAASLIALLAGKKQSLLTTITLLVAVLANLYLCFSLFGSSIDLLYPWAGFEINFSVSIDKLSSFILLAVAVFALLIGIYNIAFFRYKQNGGWFAFYFLSTITFVNGALIADNMVLMLFFWEGLLILMFGMIMLGGKHSFKAAVKAITLNGIADLCLMLGIGITVYIADNLSMSAISKLPISGLGAIGFIMMMLGAIGKAGAMPFHSWIPDAAIKAPLPFMAFLPAAIEKLLGIYLLIKITTVFYDFRPGIPMSTLVMCIGAITIILAVAMALIQRDFKRLLSYHAISQVGYMILGIGTAIPIGIVGGLFHMINHAIYKSCLFMVSGSVERQTGTTDLKRLGGLAKYTPVTMICFIVAAASISGLPPFNGFFSKEMIFDAALESGMMYYLAALIGAFLTAASFLKLGHAVFFGRVRELELAKTIDSPWAMRLPMIALSLLCILFGLANPIALQLFIQPSLGLAAGGQDFSGFPHSWLLVLISLLVLAMAFLNHLFGVKRTGSGLAAVDHIHHFPILKQCYALAEKGFFDPYNIFYTLVHGLSKLSFYIDRFINWIYDILLVQCARFLAMVFKGFDSGLHTSGIAWSLAGMALIFAMLIWGGRG